MSYPETRPHERIEMRSVTKMAKPYTPANGPWPVISAYPTPPQLHEVAETPSCQLHASKRKRTASGSRIDKPTAPIPTRDVLQLLTLAGLTSFSSAAHLVYVPQVINLLRRAGAHDAQIAYLTTYNGPIEYDVTLRDTSVDHDHSR